MTRLRRSLRIASLVLLLCAGLVVLAAAATQTAWFKDWLRRYVSRQADQYLNGQLTIDRLDGNLFTGIELQGVTLRQGSEAIVAAKDVGVTYSAFDLISGGIVIDAIRINEPRVLLKRGPEGWNVAGLVKEQAQEADREGPARPVRIAAIGISNGTITIVDAAPDGTKLPARIARIDLKGSFDYQPVNFAVEVAHLSFRAEQPDLALNSLSGRVTVTEDDVRVERVAARTAESALAVNGTVKSYLRTPVLDLAIASERITPREFAAFVPALAPVHANPAFELNVRGGLDALATKLDLRSDAGAMTLDVVADADGPEKGVRGSAAISEMDLSRLAEGLPASRLNATTEVDLALDASAEPSGGAQLRLSPTTVSGYRIESLNASATIRGGRATVQAEAVAYGARATAAGEVLPPLNGRALAAHLEGRVSGLDLRRLPRIEGVPALATRLGARYEAALDARGPSGQLVFDDSTIEGATVAAGTTVHADLRARRPVFGGRGSIRGLDLRRMGRGLRVAALDDPRLAGTVDVTFDAKGSGRTLRTLDVQGQAGVPHASLLGGEIANLVLDARLQKGRADGTLKGGFINLDPGAGAGRPDLAGAVSGAVDVAFAVPDIAAPALDQSSGRVGVTLGPSRIGEHSIDRGALAGTLAKGMFDVQSLDVQSPLASVAMSGPVSITGEGQSNLTYKVEAPDLAPLASMAGQAGVSGAAAVEGVLTGNLAELRTKGTASLTNAAYGTTARALETSVGFDVTVPDLDAQLARVDARLKSSMLEVSGTPLRAVSGNVTYLDRAATLDVRVEETAERSLDVAGRVELGQVSDVSARVDRLHLEAPDASWSLSQPANVRYGDRRVEVDRLSLVSGVQKVEVGGALSLGTAQAVSTDRPLTLNVERLDLAALDRLAKTGRALAGTLDVTAKASGTLEAPVAEMKAAVRDGAFGDFKYRSFAATVGTDAAASRLDARLDQDLGSVTVRGTLAPVPVLRDEKMRQTAPMDLRIETSAIELNVLQAFTTAVRDLTGRLQANVHVAGTMAAPALDGDVRISQGALTVVAADTKFTGLEADVRMERERVDVRRFEVHDSEGNRLGVTGGLQVSPAARTLGQMDLKLSGQNFRVLDGRFGRVAVDVEMALQGALNALRAAGSIDVRDGRIEVDRLLEEYRPLEAVDDAGPAVPPPNVSVRYASGEAASDADVARVMPGPAAPSQAGPAAPAAPSDAPSEPQPSLFDAMALDVRVKVPNNLVVRGDGVKVGGQGLSLGDLNMTLGGDLHATKAPSASPLVVGSIRTVRGFYEFQGRRFELRRDGTVSFKGPNPANPRLDVTATRDISGVEARVRVHGEAQKPELELASTPPLDEGDILSLIIFNRPINDLGEGEKTTLAQRAGSLVGGFVAAPMAEALRDALDVDLLEITPVGEEGGSSVSLGNQIGERVFVKVRQQFGSSETTQLVLEYALSDLLRLETTVAQGGDTSKTIGRRAERGAADLVFVIKY